MQMAYDHIHVQSLSIIVMTLSVLFVLLSNVFQGKSSVLQIHQYLELPNHVDV